MALKKKSKKNAKKAAAVAPIKLPARLQTFLDQRKAKFSVLQHRTVFTAFDASQTLKVDPGMIAKTLIVQLDRELAIAVIPGDRNLDVGKLKKLINAVHKKESQPAVKKVQLVTERTITNKLTDKAGAVIPIGSLYKLPTYVDSALLNEKKVIINAGSFTVSLELSGSTYRKLAEAQIGSFSKKRTN
ncbi:MAG: YbaK/EbsC family protein [Candidatus Andersenbacteria bacterium]